MAKVCELCGKKPVVGNQVTRSGKAKREGGVGKKTTGITKTWRFPNLQKVKLFRSGNAHTIRACTSCIRTGKTLGV